MKLCGPCDWCFIVFDKLAVLSEESLWNILLPQFELFNVQASGSGPQRVSI